MYEATYVSALVLQGGINQGESTQANEGRFTLNLVLQGGQTNGESTEVNAS